MGRGAAQAVVKAASDLIRRSDFSARAALQGGAAVDSADGNLFLPEKSRGIHASFAFV
jgi:hypothetical protein